MAQPPRRRSLAAMIDPTRFRREGDTPRLPTPQSWLIPAATAALLAWLVAVVPPSSLAPALAFAVWAPTLAWVDADVHRLPDALTRPATITVAAAAIAGAVVAPDPGGHLLRTVTGAGIAAAVMFALAIVAGVGLGDVKLAIPLIASAAWHSWPTAFWAFLAGWVLNAAIVIVAHLLGRRQSHSPLGPPLVLGWILAMSLINL